VRHRYVHGGFKGTDTPASPSTCPTRRTISGDFFQHITPVPDDENLAQKMPPGEENQIGFSIASGAYFVETNGGGRDHGRQARQAPMTPPSPPIAPMPRQRAIRASSRWQMYGGKRPYGYAYGGSGGAFRTIGSIENTHRRVGWRRALCARLAHGAAQHVHGAAARDARPQRQVSADPRRGRAGRQRRSLCRADTPIRHRSCAK
jgi:hypothetical protein